jgi:16S rRNA (guanine527-N7)-methyltransferase
MSGSAVPTTEPWAPARLAALGLSLAPDQVDQVRAYAALLLHWNRRINLVGTQDAQELWQRHLLDCLMLQRLPWPPQTRQAVDLGAGAGLPGVLVAILHPSCRVLCVERTAKKVTFQQVVRQELGLDNLEPLRADVATMPVPPGGFDLAMARALAELGQLLDWSRRLLRPGGVLWAMKGRRLAQEQAAIASGVAADFLPRPHTLRYRLPDAADEGVVAVYTRR